MIMKINGAFSPPGLQRKAQTRHQHTERELSHWGGGGKERKTRDDECRCSSPSSGIPDSHVPRYVLAKIGTDNTVISAFVSPVKIYVRIFPLSPFRWGITRVVGSEGVKENCKIGFQWASDSLYNKNKHSVCSSTLSIPIGEETGVLLISQCTPELLPPPGSGVRLGETRL